MRVEIDDRGCRYILDNLGALFLVLDHHLANNVGCIGLSIFSKVKVLAFLDEQVKRVVTRLHLADLLGFLLLRLLLGLLFVLLFSFCV